MDRGSYYAQVELFYYVITSRGRTDLHLIKIDAEYARSLPISVFQYGKATTQKMTSFARGYHGMFPSRNVTSAPETNFSYNQFDDVELTIN
jgi:hypothetical protein